MLEQKCKKHWITFTNTYAGTVVLEQSEQFEICSDIPIYVYDYVYDYVYVYVSITGHSISQC